MANPNGRPKGSKTSFKGHRNKALARREKKAEAIAEESLRIYNDPASTPEAKAEAWKTHLLMEKRLTRFALERKRQKEKDQRAAAIAASFDPAAPEPECLKTCGYISCSPGCPRDKWDNARRAFYQLNPELKPKAEPKPAPVIAKPAPVTFIHEEIDEPAPAPAVVRTPRPIVKPAPAPVDTFWSDFKSKPIYERNMLVKIWEATNPARYAEWMGIQDAQRAKAAAMMAARPKETTKPMSEHEKRTAFSPTPMIEVPSVGQPMTVDEYREKFTSTMGTCNPDSGVSAPIDQRSWQTLRDDQKR